jgi:DNA-binding MarR family transcriptional regulator
VAVAADPTVEAIDDALTRVVRHGMVPRTQAAIAAKAGVRVERSTYVLLRRLADCAPVRLSDLAADLGLDISTVSRQVARLTDQRLVRRQADPADARAGHLDLTARGRELLAKVRRGRHAWLAEAVDGWTDADRAELARLLACLAAAFEGASVDSAAP